MKYQADILTIGTEITSGEVINTNSAWIARQLEPRGWRVHRVLSVPDQTDLILQSLNILSDSRLLVVVGGLGPTTDDCTRACVAQWSGQPLEFSEDIWQELQTLYQQRGLPIREAHRHQCWFPRTSQKLHNPVGTAHGFFIQHNGTGVFVVPGPPRELEGLWQASVDALLPPTQAMFQLHSWSILGVPESEVAEVVEAKLAGSGYEIGYRANVPYVRVKVWTPKGDLQALARVQALESAFKTWIYFGGEVDPARELMQGLIALVLEKRLFTDVVVSDAVTGSILQQRMETLGADLAQLPIQIQSRWPQLSLQPKNSSQSSQVTEHSLILAILRDPQVHAEDEFAIQAWQGQVLVQSLTKKLPYRRRVDSEMGRRAVTEWAIVSWWQWLSKWQA